MIQIQIDEKQLNELYMSEIKKRLDQFDKELTFWDTKELKKRTCLSWNTIQEKFFFDPRFPKYKIGGKWLFPAEEAKAFLLQWISEQPKRQRGKYLEKLL